jgi:tetratricopeptide (TPR) repeat protein
MNRQIISIGTAGIIIGFILGFFSARILIDTPSAEFAGSEESLPGNHPGIDVMEKVHKLTLQSEENPENIEVRVELGNTFYDIGRYDVSARWYQEALDLDPDQARVSTDLGTSLLFLGKTEEAITQYRHSLAVQPGHGQSMQNLGVAFFSLGEYQEAIDVWKELLEKNPDYEDADKIREQITAAEEKIIGLEGETR